MRHHRVDLPAGGSRSGRGPGAAAGFGGTYVDANAIAPETTRRIAAGFEASVTYVDGSVIGPPATAAGLTRLYLSGPGAEHVAEVWADTLVEPVALSGPVGAASAIKMPMRAGPRSGRPC